MSSFLQALHTQRWDDHRYYHHSRVNQALHLVSALAFLASYALLFVDPVMAALLAWIVAMWSRQIGHFFFEPRGFDRVNGVTYEHKEEIKVGYNIQRKVVLMSLWGAVPAVLCLWPDAFGWIEPAQNFEAYMRQVGSAWLVLGVGGLLFRTVHLFFLQDVQTGLVWMVKILTDPFHDAKLYWRAPWYLLRGEWIDPMYHATAGHETAPAQEKRA